MTTIGDIPKSVTLLNMTAQKQMFEFSLTVPAGTENSDGSIKPGELVVDMTQYPSYRREKLWIAMNNAHQGEAVKIKA